jgi:hypothetical protein
MKRILIVVALLSLLAVPAASQTLMLADDSTYTSTWPLDTMKTAWTPIRSGDMSLGLWFKDSNNVEIHVDYAIAATKDVLVYKTWAVETDSTDAGADANGTFYGFVMRRGATDNVPGASWIRLRVIPKTTGNGTDSNTFDAWLQRN